MLLKIQSDADPKSLNELLAEARRHDSSTSFGEDIDTANASILDPSASLEERCDAFLRWAARYQPCLFGRLGARGQQGIGMDICWIDESEIRFGDDHLRQKIQLARRRWKEHATAGLAHGFLIMFSGPSFAYLMPGDELLTICEKISDLYLVEHAPVERDVIYTEAVPLEMPDGFGLFKAGINIFYPSAHRTRNHDRRIPGGLMISVNSPGHWANSLVLRGLSPNLKEAADKVMETALRSIGNGGIGHEGTSSASWHNTTDDTAQLTGRRSLRKLPRYIPEDYTQKDYSALYHTDVLVPTDVTVDATIDPDVTRCEHWKNLVLNYISEDEVPQDHLNYALFHGHPIHREAIFHNPWPPRRAINSPLSD